MHIDITNNTIHGFDKNGKPKEHKPLSTSFTEIKFLSDGRLVIIEDYYKFTYKEYSNLYCLNSNMEIDWFLEFPNDTPDRYVGFGSESSQLYAYSGGGFMVEIDLVNGKISSTQFTK